MFAVFVNKNDGKGWVRGFKKNYDTATAAVAAAKKFERVWVVRL